MIGRIGREGSMCVDDLVDGGLVELRGSWAMSPPVLLFAQPGEDTSSRMRFPGRNTFDVARRSTRS